MPSGKSSYLIDEILDHIYGGGDFARPATLYCALFTVTPTAAGGGTEATGGSYARVAITNNNTNFPAAAGGVKRNGTAITFPAATADWGDIVAAAFFDASSGGNMISFGAFSVTRTVRNGDTFEIPINGATITEA